MKTDKTYTQILIYSLSQCEIDRILEDIKKRLEEFKHLKKVVICMNEEEYQKEFENYKNGKRS